MHAKSIEPRTLGGTALGAGGGAPIGAAVAPVLSEEESQTMVQRRMSLVDEANAVSECRCVCVDSSAIEQLTATWG